MTHDNDMIRRGDALAIIAAQMKDSRRTYKGFGHAQEALRFAEQMLAATVTALEPQPHVNEPPKSEHDARDVLTAQPNHAYRVGFAAGRAAAIREAAETVQAGDTVQAIQRRILALLDKEKPHE